MAGKKKRGRPKGRKSNPDYTTMTLYIKRDLRKHFHARTLLLDTDMSTVAEELIQEWLENNP